MTIAHNPIRFPPSSLSSDPCFEPVIRLPLPGNRKRIRVVELLSTGSSGGAQEHGNFVQLAFGANFLKGVHDRANDTRAYRDEGIAIAPKNNHNESYRKEDNIEKIEEIVTDDIPV